MVRDMPECFARAWYICYSAKLNVECENERGKAYVVEEADTGGDVDNLRMLRSGLAIQVDRHLNLSLIRLALDRSCARFHSVHVRDGGSLGEVRKYPAKTDVRLGVFGLAVR